MKISMRSVRSVLTLLAVAAAILVAVSPSRAGSIYVVQKHYSWSYNVSIPILPLGGSVTYPVNSYAYTYTGVEVVGDSGPFGPSFQVGTEYVYEGGGPLNDEYDEFQTSVTYWQKVDGTHILTTIPYGPPGHFVTLYTTWWPQILHF